LAKSSCGGSQKQEQQAVLERQPELLLLLLLLLLPIPSQGFLFSILSSWWTGDHPEEDEGARVHAANLGSRLELFVHFAPDFVFGTLLCFFNPPFQLPCYQKKCRLASRAEQNTGSEEKKKASQTKTRRL